MSRWIERWKSWSAKPGSRRLLLTAGAFLFFGSLTLALVNLPDSPERVRWRLLLLVPALLAPASMYVSAVEFRLTGALAGRYIGAMESIRVSVVSSLANLLPLPGSFVVRAGHLAGHGVSVGRATAAPAVLALGWTGMSAAAAGALMLTRSQSQWGLVFLAGGAAALLAGFMILNRLNRRRRWLLAGSVVLVETISVGISITRYYVILSALGFDPTLEASTVLALASVLGVVAGIVPGGLGIREVLAGVFGLIVDLDVAVGVLAASVNRLLGLIALAAVAVLLLAQRRTGSGVAPGGATSSSIPAPDEDLE